MTIRREAKYEFNGMLRKQLAVDTEKYFGTSPASIITIPDGKRGAYGVQHGSGAALDQGVLMSGPETESVTVTCYGHDEETVDTLYDELEAVLKGDHLQYCCIAGLQREITYDDAQTYIVRAVMQLIRIN